MISAISFQTNACYSTDFILSQFDDIAQVEYIYIKQLIQFNTLATYDQYQIVAIVIRNWQDTELAHQIVYRLKMTGYAYVEFFCTNSNSIQAFCLQVSDYSAVRQFAFNPYVQCFCVYNNGEELTEDSEQQDQQQDQQQDPEDSEQEDIDYDALMQQYDQELDYDQEQDQDLDQDLDQENDDYEHHLYDFDPIHANPAGIRGRINFLKHAAKNKHHLPSDIHRDICDLQRLI